VNHPLRLHPVSPGICQVLTEAGLHIGNLKLMGSVWKFKAIGYDASGQVIPGGGSLTDRHNTAFTGLDEAEINRVLA
jgi:hypothetical protein